MLREHPAPHPSRFSRKTVATRAWWERNRERINEARRAEYQASRPVRVCSECGRMIEGKGWVVCSRRCKDARYRRLHPVEYAAKQRRKYQRRRAA